MSPRAPAAVATAIALIVGVSFAGCGSSDSASSIPDTAPVREASGAVGAGAADPISIAMKVLGGGYDVYVWISKCSANQEVGQPCTATDGDNIRETLKEVRELRAQIEANRKEASQDFDRIAELLLGQTKEIYKSRLRGMDKSGALAMKAYESLLTCAADPKDPPADAKPRPGERTVDPRWCVPYPPNPEAPGGLEPASSTKTQAGALESTRLYLLQKVSEMPGSVPEAVEAFTGSADEAYRDGLANAIWRYNKQAQDTKAGVTKPAVKRSETVPLVSPELANAQSRQILYWARMFAQYGALKTTAASIQAAKIKEGTDERRTADAAAENLFREVTQQISDPTGASGREAIKGSASFYNLPELPEGSLLTVGGDGATTILYSGLQQGGGRFVRPDDVRRAGVALSAYAPAETFAKNLSAMPPDRFYKVKQPIRRASYSNVCLYITSGSVMTCPTFTVGPVAWLAGSDATEACVVRMRPMDTRPAWGGRTSEKNYRVTAVKGPVEWQGQKGSTPPMGKNDLAVAWDKDAPGPIDYDWDERWAPQIYGGVRYGIGWGAWVRCGETREEKRAHTAWDLPAKPPVVGPAE